MHFKLLCIKSFFLKKSIYLGKMLCEDKKKCVNACVYVCKHLPTLSKVLVLKCFRFIERVTLQSGFFSSIDWFLLFQYQNMGHTTVLLGA